MSETLNQVAARLRYHFQTMAEQRSRELNARTYGAGSWALAEGAPSVRDTNADSLADMAELLETIVNLVTPDIA